MKKTIITIFIAFSCIINAQEKNDQWFHKNVETTKVFGVATDDALSFLKSKGIKPKTVIVGVIDSGVEADHEDLKNNMWVNTKEAKGKPGVDDDANGYIDDVHGWNFIGNKNGQNISFDTYELTRIIKNYQSIFEGENAEKFKIDNPDKAKIYEKAKLKYQEKKSEAENSLANIKGQKDQAINMFNAVKDFTKDIPLTKENIEKIQTNTDRDKQLKEIILQMVSSPEIQGKTASEFINFLEKDFKEGIDYYTNNLEYYLNLDFNPRNIVGDNYSNKAEKNYGNNDYEATDAEHGTHVAGIIAAQRNNQIGIDGIAGDVAKILTVRAVPDGDERDKDIANAIYYSVNNGAQIINMSFGKAFSPEVDIVWQAIKYAESKDVLLIHAAGNENEDLDIEENFPTNFKRNDTKPFVSNWITVGASSEDSQNLKASFSNYGSMKVDVFAPGNNIYSLIPDNKYKSNSGTSMAAPVVAGCAAVLKAYFPKLTSFQIKEILMQSSNKSNQSSAISIDENENPKNRAFDTLSVSGGIVDLYKAVKLAYEKYSK